MTLIKSTVELGHSAATLYAIKWERCNFNFLYRPVNSVRNVASAPDTPVYPAAKHC